MTERCSPEEDAELAAGLALLRAAGCAVAVRGTDAYPVVEWRDRRYRTPIGGSELRRRLEQRRRLDEQKRSRA